MEKYYYKLYGINIESQIELKELIKSNKSENDVKISYGNVPNDVIVLMEQGCRGYCTEKIMWFEVENVAVYYVSNGNNIIVQAYKNCSIYDIKTYLLGTALGMLMIQRNSVAIHGGTIVVDNKAITIVGDTGAGKSTLTSGLRIKGYPFMADDVSVLSESMVNFSYPQQKLCKDAMKSFGYDLNDYTMIDDDREKYVVPVKDNFIMKPMKLSAIFEVSISDDIDVSIEEIKGSEKLKILMKNIYRVEILNIVGFNQQYFKACVNLMNNIHLYKIKRPKNQFSINRQIEAIENTMKAI